MILSETEYFSVLQILPPPLGSSSLFLPPLKIPRLVPEAKIGASAERNDQEKEGGKLPKRKVKYSFPTASVTQTRLIVPCKCATPLPHVP